MATRKVSTPGATETTTPDPAPTAETENTTGTVSEPVAEVVADQTQEQSTPEPTEQAEAAPALPDDYEEYLAWKNSQAKQAEEPVIAVTAQASNQQANGVKRKRPVLGPEGWTQEEY